MASTRNLLRAARDTYIRSSRPSENYSDAKRIMLQTGEARGFLHFNRPFPLGATVVSATLRLYTKGVWGSSSTVTVYRVMERWAISRINWNNQPTVGDVPATTLTQSSATDADVWEFDVTNAMQNVSNGAVWYGFRLQTDATGAKLFHSADSVDHQPELEVVWSEAPQQPTNLIPSGDQVVSIAKWVMSADFTDRAGSTALQAVQAQVDPAANGASPAFDSGTVLSTEPELDLATTSYAGLAAGSSTKQRIRFQDGSGQWSPWSDWESVHRDNKGTGSIDNPPASGIISEWTPPMIGTLTGETLTSWQVFVTPDDERATRLADSGRTKHMEAGNTFSWTLPKGVIEDEGDYRAVFRFWDSKDRVATATDKPYVEVIRTFHFNEDPTPNPVTGLEVANLLPRPWAMLTWDRATAPDSFVVKRDGKVIESGIDPADVLTVGTSYAWIDRDAAPFKTHTWRVQSVVNNTTSTGPDVSMLVQSQGIWLYDHDRDIDVFIAGRDEGTWAMGEEATTHFPLGADQGVRITQAMRGYEGTITGELVDTSRLVGGKTVQGWENQLLKIKERPGRVCTLSVGDEAFRCVVGNISIAPTPTTPITRRVSLEFWQVGRLGFDVRW